MFFFFLILWIAVLRTRDYQTLRRNTYFLQWQFAKWANKSKKTTWDSFIHSVKNYKASTLLTGDDQSWNPATILWGRPSNLWRGPNEEKPRPSSQWPWLGSQLRPAPTCWPDEWASSKVGPPPWANPVDTPWSKEALFLLRCWISQTADVSAK